MRPTASHVLLVTLLIFIVSCGGSPAEQQVQEDDTVVEASSNAQEDTPRLPEGNESLTIAESDGGSVVTNLGYGYAVNKGSSLQRKFYVINDVSSPVTLEGAGVGTKYADRDYSFYPTGNLTPNIGIAAFEVRYLLFDIWGQHLKTLSSTKILDLPEGQKFALHEVGSWRAWDNDVSEYLSAVSFVARVRRTDGTGWSANTEAILKLVTTLNLQPSEEDLAPKEEK